MTRKMKKSRIPFVEEIPLNWDETRLRTIGEFSSSGIDKTVNENEVPIGIINYVDVYNNKTLKLGKRDYMMVTTSPEKASKHIVNVGDLIFTPSSETVEDIGVSALVDEPLGNVAFSYHVLRFEFNKQMNHEFKKYLCNNCATYNYFSSRAVGTIRKTLSRDVFKETRVTIPPMDEQQRIADFLDAKCAKIDVAIEKTQKTIEEYKALKQSIITEAVTKGIRGDRPVKDSGIEWIGIIPDEWEIAKFKNLGRCRNGLTYSPEDQCDEEGTLVLRSSNIQEGELVFSDCVYVNKGIPDDLMVKPGDILICSRNGSATLIGKNALIPEGLQASFGAFMMIYRCESPRYLQYVMRSNVFSYYLGTFLTVSVNQLTGKNFDNIRFPFTKDVTEQTEIVDYLDKKCANIDTLIKSKQKLVTELESYKKTLIYEYVTGKKEVKK